MKKSYVLDTNVLLYNPNSIFSFQDNEVVLPLIVLDELDKKKVGVDGVAKHARMVIRHLDELRASGKLQDGVALENGGTLRIEMDPGVDTSLVNLDQGRSDNKIIGAILGLKRTNPNVKLVTKDINLRVKCDALDIEAEDYYADSVVKNPEAIYTGTATVCTHDWVIDKLYKEGKVDVIDVECFDLYENQYLMLTSNINPQHTALGRYSMGMVHKISFSSTSKLFGVSPRNREQVFAIDALMNPDIKLVTLIGSAGTGKTLCAAAAGVSQILESTEYKKLLMTRPVQPLGKDIGFLPGGIEEKLAPWMAPLQDNLEFIFSEKGMKYMEVLKEKGTLSVEAMTYIRGRSIPKSFIICDEAQNLTLHEVKTIITRIGEGSKIVLTGDIMQIDTTFIDSTNNGLSCAVEKFKDQAIAAHVTLTKGERSALATIAAEIL